MKRSKKESHSKRRMKLSAYISPVLYKQYCRVNWLEDTDESLRRFLRDIGTHSITFQQADGEYRVVPPGACIRLHTSDTYAVLSNRYLNLYSTLFTKQTEVRPAAPKPSWWCSWW